MLDSLKNPPAGNRLLPFWVWPASPDPDTVEWQVREMHAHGIGGFFVCGPEPPARRDVSAWASCVQRAEESCADLGIEPHFPGIDYEYTGDGEDAPEQPSPFSIDQIRAAKIASSAVHAAGHTHLLSRVCGSENWALSPEEMKRLVDFEAILGANVFCPEVFHYTIAGLSLGDPPPPQFYQSTFWPHYGAFADYAARLSYVMTQGRHRSQVALLYPAKAFALPRAHLRSETIHGLAVGYFNVFCEWLLKNHIDYDVVGEATLLRTTVVDQRLHLAGEQYELLVIPPLAAIDYDVALKIKEFADDGGRVLGTCVLPLHDSGGRDDEGVRRLFAELFGADPAELRAGILTERSPGRPRLTPHGSALFFQAARPADLIPRIRPIVSKALKPDVSIKRGPAECPDILCCRRETEEADIFLFINTAPEPREVRISIRCDRAPHMLNLETAEITALPNCTQQGSRTVLLHRFDRHASLFIAFGDEPALAVAAPAIEGGQEMTLAGQWEFSTTGPNVLPLADWDRNGQASVEITHQPRELLLVVEGQPSGHLGVLVNGAAVVESGWVTDIGFRAFDVQRHVRVGLNTFSLKSTAPDSECVGRAALRPRLLGDFSLSGNGVLSEPAASIKTGSWTDQGYPHYSGSGIYRQTVEIPPFLRGQRVVIRAQAPADIVEFLVNGASAGVRLWPPFQVDITPLVKPGPNTIELTITNTLTNGVLFEKRPSGLLGGAIVIIA